MRAALRIVAGLVAAMVVTAACSGASPATTAAAVEPTTAPSVAAAVTTDRAVSTTATSATATTDSPEETSDVVIGIAAEPATLNPFAPGGDFISTTTVAQLHLAGVYDIDAVSRTLVPELVEELPSPSNGGVELNEDGTMTVRYRIRASARWSDGVPVSGDDFQFTLDAIRQLSPPDEGSTSARLLRQAYDEIVATEIGPNTFAFTMVRPTAGYERLFGYIVPAHAVAGTDLVEDWPAADWPAAGPFVVDAYVPGESVRFVRNESYWKLDSDSGTSLPRLGSVTVRFIPDVALLVGGIIDGDVDVISPPPFEGIADTFSAVGNIELQQANSSIWEHVGFQFGPDNRNPESLNRHLAFRQAVAHAIDRPALAQAAGWGSALSTLRSLSPDTDVGPWDQYQFDPGLAEELLDVACTQAERDCAAEPPVLVYSTTEDAAARPALAGALGGMLEEVGIDFVLELEDSELFFEGTLNDGTWDVGGWAWVHRIGMDGERIIMEIFDPAAGPPEGNNYYHWGTPGSTVAGETAPQTMVELLDRARQAVDPVELALIYGEFEQLLADNAVVIPVAARPSLLAVRTDHVVGVVHNPTDAGFTWNVEQWTVP